MVGRAGRSACHDRGAAPAARGVDGLSPGGGVKVGGGRGDMVEIVRESEMRINRRWWVMWEWW